MKSDNETVESVTRRVTRCDQVSRGLGGFGVGAGGPVVSAGAVVCLDRKAHVQGRAVQVSVGDSWLLRPRMRGLVRPSQSRLKSSGFLRVRM